MQMLLVQRKLSVVTIALVNLIISPFWHKSIEAIQINPGYSKLLNTGLLFWRCNIVVWTFDCDISILTMLYGGL